MGRAPTRSASTPSAGCRTRSEAVRRRIRAAPGLLHVRRFRLRRGQDRAPQPEGGAVSVLDFPLKAGLAEVFGSGRPGSNACPRRCTYRPAAVREPLRPRHLLRQPRHGAAGRRRQRPSIDATTTSIRHGAASGRVPRFGKPVSNAANAEHYGQPQLLGQERVTPRRAARSTKSLPTARPLNARVAGGLQVVELQGDSRRVLPVPRARRHAPGSRWCRSTGDAGAVSTSATPASR